MTSDYVCTEQNCRTASLFISAHREQHQECLLDLLWSWMYFTFFIPTRASLVIAMSSVVWGKQFKNKIMRFVCLFVFYCRGAFEALSCKWFCSYYWWKAERPSLLATQIFWGISYRLALASMSHSLKHFSIAFLLPQLPLLTVGMILRGRSHWTKRFNSRKLLCSL